MNTRTTSIRCSFCNCENDFEHDLPYQRTVFVEDDYGICNHCVVDLFPDQLEPLLQDLEAIIPAREQVHVRMVTRVCMMSINPDVTRAEWVKRARHVVQIMHSRPDSIRSRFAHHEALAA